MNAIAEHGLEPRARRWVLVALAVAVLFVASLAILGQAEPAPSGDQVHALDTGL